MILNQILSTIRVVIKSQGPGIFPGYYECSPRLLLLEKRTKIEPKEIPTRLIPCLLVVFTWQLEILVTTLTILKRNVWRLVWILRLKGLTAQASLQALQ